VLSVRDVDAGYGGSTALHGASIDVAAGETVALVGANGAGKSTLLKTISGLVRVRRGAIVFNGTDVTALPASRRVALGIAHVPEGREVFGTLTVAENLEIGAYAAARRSASREIDARRDEVLARFPALRDRLDRSAAELSGGQQQMLAIGRGLMAGPRLLLLDEPSLGLAPTLVHEIFAIVRELRTAGIGVLIAEQNARMALGVADRGYVLENGRVVLSGTGPELLGSPQIAERYLGMGTAAAVRTSEADALSARLRAILGSARAASRGP
jgi:branched-chain amino acid transport system ATP-binding protein